MAEEYPDLITPEDDGPVTDYKGTPIMKVLFIVVIAMIIICCCCFSVLAALYYGTEPFMELVGIPIPW